MAHRNALKMNKNEFKTCFRKEEGHLCLKNEKKNTQQSPTKIDLICKTKSGVIWLLGNKIPPHLVDICIRADTAVKTSGGGPFLYTFYLCFIAN